MKFNKVRAEDEAVIRAVQLRIEMAIHEHLPAPRDNIILSALLTIAGDVLGYHIEEVTREDVVFLADEMYKTAQHRARLIDQEKRQTGNGSN